MAHSSQGIVRDEKGQEQPADKRRAQTAHQTASKDSVSKEATRDPNSPTATRRPDRSGALPDDKGDGTKG
jgi:hypothetical protein